MIHITLPDGSLREYDQSLSVFEVAASIGIGLAKAAVAGRVNGTLVEQRIYGVCWANQQELDEWRAPQQVVVVNIDERQIGYAQSVTEALRRAGFRANSDLRKKNIGNKIRHHTLLAVPYLLVIGDKEMDGGFVSLRSGKGEDFGRMSVEAVCERLRIEVDAVAGKAAALPAIEIKREV
ncbi:hypothetical protein C1Y08_03910 [Pseudomonas sp. FW306-02-F02-AA]|uniref:TGS domain-containing protein n=1 Tax=Pseudomonas fluorescens TaxID=294 RepID=A0A0N9W4V7_PSEFL|nr:MULTISPECIES: His/Gly/Thr/Pro-type tRNA ligase C-terminal domain-containing protein [Pseudomonas]ALI01415.1 hypothetical protein AO353_10155 [Pseudomonas fluorescens]PMZ05871.1 hypothetical protein C1Y07_02495 [Pseudomonas sp. FW306-02-F02-AB]PMZ11441.1 hypothetical protein C1Y06_04225 [Pseudomonas sp. FW306-02-H06C]PMZ17364.1 hypothetical protein C1Y08_03910 [Pseudomonas sp. FW306-02-F02-AA]PMZ23081.1 hypothetical protein C1Y09_05570 [Pseudomonas sp. FW306-02-F08-AA]